MICLTCREAADRRAPRDQHCTSHGGPGTACDCQHHTDRYRTADGLIPAMRTALAGVKAALGATRAEFALAPTPTDTTTTKED